MKKGKRRLAAFLAAVMTATCVMGTGITAKADTCGGLEPEDVYQPSPEEVIQDPILHWAVRAAMNSIKGGITLTQEVVGDKSVKHITYDLCAHPEDFETEEWAGKQFWVGSLEGLQYAKSATLIDIAYTSAVEGKCLSDLSPLSDLTQLQELILKQNGISDISDLKKLVNLTWLDVSGNREIADISAVSDMTKLKRLIVSHNKVEEAEALANLESLEYLDISYNKIASLPDLSKLKKVTFLDASHNDLSDVSALSGMKELQILNLSGNDKITDIKPLANLLKLDKNSTVLPDESKKEDLFAAIEVNKLFSLFNISKMQESDLTNVQNALDAYEALTGEQKSYMDQARVEAARSNKQKVETGREPEYYPEYDIEGEKQPIFNKLEIKVVDKRGVPIADAEFKKISKNAYGQSETIVKTDSIGRLVLKHTSLDPMYDIITIIPAGENYVAFPTEMTYTVAWGGVTSTVNGNAATGLEELQFTLISKGEYVDKSELKSALEQAALVEEAYKYTEVTYRVYENALKQAKTVFEDVDATQERVEDAAKALSDAIQGLVKEEILTALKLIVKDENGNIFTRPFKFQIRVPGTGAEAWNQLSDPYTGVVYLQSSPGWENGKTWEVLSCYEEPYEFESFLVTIGVKDGKRYYKTVDGKAVGVDFQKEVIVKLRPDGAPDKNNERKPESTVLESYINSAKGYNSEAYTPTSYEQLQNAISNAENTLTISGATQNDYNAAAAAIKKAEAELVVIANKVKLRDEIAMKDSYSEEYFTAETWAVYDAKFQEASAVYADGNATQYHVDKVCEELARARKALVAKADKEKLGEKLEEAKALKEEDYESGFEELQRVIATAQRVYDGKRSTQSQVDEQVTALEGAIAALVQKQAEIDYSCEPGRFRAKVVNQKGIPVKGVKFQAWIGDTMDTEGSMTSDGNGIISYTTYGPVQYGKTTFVKLADDRYTTEDEHSFTVTNSSLFAAIATVDGSDFTEGIKLTYVLKRVDGSQEADKTELESKIAEMKEIVQGNYTRNSYNAFRDAIKKAEVICDSEEATNETVADAIQKLEDAKANLREVKGMRTLVIPVKNQDGTEAPANTKFIRFDCMYYVENPIYVEDGVLEWKIGSYDGGDYEFYLSDSSVYITTPEIVKVHVGDEDGTPVIDTINGQPVDTQKQIVFTLSKKENKPVVDLSELQKCIEEAGALDKGKYTDETYSKVEEELAKAIALIEKEGVTQGEINTQLSNLRAALEGLKELEPTPTPEPEPTPDPEPTPNPGTSNDYKAELKNKKDVEGKVPLKEEEKAAIAAGEKLDVILRLTATTKTAVTDEQKTIDAKLGSYKMGTFLEIELLKKVGDAEPEKVTETDGVIEITLEVPSELRNKDAKVTRTYKVMRNHNGVVDVLDATFDAQTNMLTFKTDKFSTYALVYSDSTASTTNSSTTSTTPQTGDMANTSVYAAMLGISLLAVVAVWKKREKMK